MYCVASHSPSTHAVEQIAISLCMARFAKSYSAIRAWFEERRSASAITTAQGLWIVGCLISEILGCHFAWNLPLIFTCHGLEPSHCYDICNYFFGLLPFYAFVDANSYRSSYFKRVVALQRTAVFGFFVVMFFRTSGISRHRLVPMMHN